MKKFLLILLLLFAVIIAALIALLKPYESFHESRPGSGLEEILVEYVNVTGNSGCTKLYILEPDSKKVSDLAIFPAVPESMKSPDDGVYAYHGNVFILTGFPYEWVYYNSITGVERRERSARFDIVKWEINAPYIIWSDKQGENGEPLTESSSLELSFQIKVDDHQEGDFKMENYVDCLEPSIE